MSVRRFPKDRTRRLPGTDIQGISDARVLPDGDFEALWDSIFLPEDMKQRLVRETAANIQIRVRIANEAIPLHGLALLVGEPGVGKTSLAKGLASRIASVVKGIGTFAFVEIDTHGLTSSSLGKSERSVKELFDGVLTEYAQEGPLTVLVDEIETLATDRKSLSMEANPVDVHRAVDAALVGLDRLARINPNVVILGTSNFPEALDRAIWDRADLIRFIPLPDELAREKILRHAVDAFIRGFPGAKGLQKDSFIRNAVSVSDNLTGRRIRKAIASACSIRSDSLGDPGKVTGDDILAALHEAKEQEYDHRS